MQGYWINNICMLTKKMSEMVLLEYFLLFRKILYLISETRIYCPNLQEDAKMIPLFILSKGILLIFHTFDLTLGQF